MDPGRRLAGLTADVPAAMVDLIELERCETGGWLMSAATAPPDILDGGAGFPGGAPAADLRAVFGDLMRLHAEAAGIRAEARHRVPHDLDERLAGLARGLGRAAGRLSTSCPSPRAALITVPSNVPVFVKNAGAPAALARMGMMVALIVMLPEAPVKRPVPPLTW